MKRLALLVFIVLLTQGVMAQNQFRLGQYMVHQPFINPAAIASYSCPTVALHYRKQWVGFEGAPTNQSVAFSMPLHNKSSFVGGSVLHDKIGVNNSTKLSGSYAYQLKLPKGKIAFGLSGQLNFIQSNFGSLNLRDGSDPLLSNDSPLFVTPNFRFGAYFHQSNQYIGFAIPNLLENKLEPGVEIESKTLLNPYDFHYHLHAGRSFKLTSDLTLNSSFLLKHVNGSPLQFDLSAQVMYQQIGLGLSYRSSKELLPMLSVPITRGLRLNYAYEINFDVLGDYSSGSHEVVLVYRICPPKTAIIEAPRF